MNVEEGYTDESLTYGAVVLGLLFMICFCAVMMLLRNSTDLKGALDDKEDPETNYAEVAPMVVAAAAAAPVI